MPQFSNRRIPLKKRTTCSSRAKRTQNLVLMQKIKAHRLKRSRKCIRWVSYHNSHLFANCSPLRTVKLTGKRSTWLARISEKSWRRALSPIGQVCPWVWCLPRLISWLKLCRRHKNRNSERGTILLTKTWENGPAKPFLPVMTPANTETKLPLKWPEAYRIARSFCPFWVDKI